MGQYWSQSFPPTSKFNPDDIPDLSGKVMIVTGGNSGIGKETVRALLAHNAKVYMASRSSDKAKAAIEELRKDTGKEALFLHLDLASLNGVRRAAEEFLSKETELHTLYNSAGIMFLTKPPQELEFTEDGYDMQWGTNVVGPFYFTQLLMPAILAAAQSSPDKKARVTFTASIVQGKTINWDSFKDTPARKKMCADQRYAQSKFANTVLARELARRYGDKGLVSMAVNPGNIRSELQRHMNGIVRKMLDSVMHPTPMGAINQLWAGTSPEGAELNGKYVIPWARVGVPPPASQDPELGQKLWTCLEEQVKERTA